MIVIFAVVSLTILSKLNKNLGLCYKTLKAYFKFFFSKVLPFTVDFCTQKRVIKFFYLGFIPCKTGQPLQGMKLEMKRIYEEIKV